MLLEKFKRALRDDHYMQGEFDDIITKASADTYVFAVVLFGSRARSMPYRDTDICLFVKEDADVDKLVEYIASFGDKYDVHLFKELPLYIRARILKEGKILMSKSFDMLFEAYRNTIREYDLFKPHFEAYLGVTGYE
jgi:predicted nucleotidyltransferase